MDLVVSFYAQLRMKEMRESVVCIEDKEAEEYPAYWTREASKIEAEKIIAKIPESSLIRDEKNVTWFYNYRPEAWATFEYHDDDVVMICFSEGTKPGDCEPMFAQLGLYGPPIETSWEEDLLKEILRRKGVSA
jgi:hypothetical protein